MSLLYRAGTECSSSSVDMCFDSAATVIMVIPEPLLPVDDNAEEEDDEEAEEDADEEEAEKAEEAAVAEEADEAAGYAAKDALAVRSGP